MLLSNSKIDYSSVRRMPSVKLSGQTQGTATTTTTNTMPASTSLQDISSHHTQKLTWNNNKDQQLINYSEKALSSNVGRQLNISHSDERIFEHPEVTIKPSALDDEIQRRLLTMKNSITNENLIENDRDKSAPNILEHPDMRAPIVMQPQQISSSASSSAISIQNDCKRVSRTQSADIYRTMARTPSPGNNHVDFYIDNNQNPKRSTSPGSFIDHIIERLEQEKIEDFHSPSTTTTTITTTTTTTVSICEYSEPSSKSIKTEINDS